MILNETQAQAIYLKIIHSDPNELRKLNQFHRKLCLKAIETLTDSNKNVEVKLPKKVTYERTVQELADRLEDLPKENKPKLVRLFLAITKGLLNRLSLRISSKEVESKINSVKEHFVSHHMREYFNEYCTLIGDVEPNTAEILFLGDHHGDRRQLFIRDTLVKQFSKVPSETDKPNSVYLVEGPVSRYTCFNTNYESWERGPNYQKSLELLNKKMRTLKKLAQLRSSLWMRFRLSGDEREKRALYLERKSARLQEQANKLHEQRDLDLIETVKERRKQTNKKIFAIAGTFHLYRPGHDIRDHFPGIRCALVIPKTRPLAHKMLPLLKAKMVKQGRYTYTHAA